MRSAFSPLAREAVPPRDSIPPMPRSLAAPQLLLLLGAAVPCPGPASRRARSSAPYAARLGECTRQGPNECRPGASYEGVATTTGRRDGRSDARGTRLTRTGPVVADAESCPKAHRKMSA